MISVRSKRRKILSLVFILKYISKKLLIKREGLIVFSATKNQQFHILPDRYISTDPFISNSFKFYLFMYLFTYSFTFWSTKAHSTNCSHKGLSRFILLLFLSFTKEDENVANLACLATQVYFSHSPPSHSFVFCFFFRPGKMKMLHTPLATQA